MEAIIALSLLSFICFGFSWLLTKGIIFVAFQLFNINWHDKFWAVFVAIILVQLIFNSSFRIKK